MRNHEIYIQSFVDAFDDQTAVINHDGVIQYTNGAWDAFHLENVEILTTAAFIGDHYLDTLISKGNLEASEGIKRVIDKNVEEYVLTYPCRSLSSESWFQLIVRRCLLNEFQEGLILVNRNIKIEDVPDTVMVDFIKSFTDAVFTVDAARKNLELEMKQLVYLDELTNLPNSRSMDRIIEKSIYHREDCALFCIDLDGFKKINDLYGREMGDKLLKEVGRKLQRAVAGFGIVGRIGDDEFLVFAKEKRTSELEEFASSLLRVFSNPFIIEGIYSFSISASVGISQFPQEALDKNHLMNAANTAMHEAKRIPGNQYKFYEVKMTTELTRRLNIEQALTGDLRQNGLYFVFQPQIDGLTNEMIGLEVLSRWQHPTIGKISPLEFIEIAEETGNISILTNYLMEEVFSKVSSWIKTMGFSKKVSFNVTSHLLSQETFFKDLFDLLDQFNIPYHQIELEITEETQLEVSEFTLDTIKACRERGIQIAIDDFGIGYSMLKSLTHFPIDKIKIDKYFINRLGKDSQTESVIKTIVYLAKSLGCIVVAEGVESAGDVKALSDLGCQFFQGYYFNWPLKVEEFERLYIYD